MALKNRKQIRLEKTADVATKWIGSTASLIVHTVIFVISFALAFFRIVHFEPMLLVLTTLISLEAIYLSIFIQMSINKNSEVIEIIQEDVGEIQEDIEEIEEDIDEIQKDVDEIQDDSQNDQIVEKKESEALANIQAILLTLQKEIEALKKNNQGSEGIPCRRRATVGSNFCRGKDKEFHAKKKKNEKRVNADAQIVAV